MKLLVASRNKKKCLKLEVLVAAHLTSIEVVGLDEVKEYPETPETASMLCRESILKPVTVPLIPVK